METLTFLLPTLKAQDARTVDQEGDLSGPENQFLSGFSSVCSSASNSLTFHSLK